MLTPQEREKISDLFGHVPEDGPLEALITYVEQLVTEHVQEALTNALHPEFGTEWREPDGVIWKAAEAAKQAQGPSALGERLFKAEKTIQNLLKDKQVITDLVTKHRQRAQDFLTLYETLLHDVRAVHEQYFDMDTKPPDANPEPGDVWRYDRDLRAVIYTTED